MLIKHVQVLLGIFVMIGGIVYISCEEDDECATEAGEAGDAGIYGKQRVCNDDGVCDVDETVMSCPADCWDVNQTTTCRAAYNETRMSCMDFTVDMDATDKTPMEVYQFIYDSCERLGQEEQCQLIDDTGALNEEECIFKVSQKFSCLDMACVDVLNYHICMISPRNTDTEQIMSLDYGVTTIPVFPYDGWTQMACDSMSGLGMDPPVSNEIIKDDDLTCDLY